MAERDLPPICAILGVWTPLGDAEESQEAAQRSVALFESALAVGKRFLQM